MLLLLTLVALAACGEQGAKDTKAEPSAPDAPSGDTLLADERAFGKFAVQVRWSDGGKESQRIEISRDGRMLWSRAGHRFAFDSRVNEQAAAKVWGQGSDATGDNEPELIIREWTGGSGCCFTFIVVTLADPVIEVGTIDAGASGRFEDLDGDGVPEFVGQDWTFRGWHTTGPDSPAPRIVLRLGDDGFELAPELMERPAPTPEQRERLVMDVLTSADWGPGNPPPLLWGTALDLMYAGHPDLGWNFLDWAWPEDRPGREEFIAEFRSQLTRSPYAADLGL